MWYFPFWILHFLSYCCWCTFCLISLFLLFLLLSDQYIFQLYIMRFYIHFITLPTLEIYQRRGLGLHSSHNSPCIFRERWRCTRATQEFICWLIHCHCDSVSHGVCMAVVLWREGMTLLEKTGLLWLRDLSGTISSKPLTSMVPRATLATLSSVLLLTLLPTHLVGYPPSPIVYLVNYISIVEPRAWHIVHT